MTSEPIQLRLLLTEDLPQALALQARCYAPHLRDGPLAFQSRLVLGPDTCWAAWQGAELVGYLLAHPWRSMSPPAVDTVLEAIPGPGPQIHYIHDLSVASAARGTGLATRLVTCALESARAQGLAASELVAVQGARGFWERRGYALTEVTPELSRKLASYGTDARYLSRAL